MYIYTINLCSLSFSCSLALCVCAYLEPFEAKDVVIKI